VFDTFPDDLMLQDVEGNIMVVSACRVNAYNADIATSAGDASVSEAADGDKRQKEIKPGSIVIQVGNVDRWG
jgi:patatin-like phospholipase/acyl hydrolase